MSISDATAVLKRERAAEFAFAQGEVRVVAERLDVDGETFAALSSWLSRDEMERARRCHFDRDRRRFIVARARLRELLATRLGISPDAVEFEIGDYGKPALGGKQAGWHFNASRSADVAVFALSASRRVGVDVEAIREVRGADEIVEHCFSRAERNAYRALEQGNRLLGFFNCWTRKEAFVKALGTGMSWSYDRFDVSLAPGQEARLLRVDDLTGDESGWRLEAFAPQDGFIAALVSEAN